MFEGWVFYDADCARCRRLARRTDELLARRGWHLVPLQAEWARQKLGLKQGAPLLEMKLVTADGVILGGADAVVRLARTIWWAWPLPAIAALPGAKPVIRVVYRYIAGNRHCTLGWRGFPSKGEPDRPHRHRASSFYEMP